MSEHYINSIVKSLDDEFLLEFGMTRGALKEYFEKVQNPDGWKLPIESVCEVSEAECVRGAIIFFTGSQPYFKYVGENKCYVKADGYYATMGE